MDNCKRCKTELKQDEARNCKYCPTCHPLPTPGELSRAQEIAQAVSPRKLEIEVTEARVREICKEEIYKVLGTGQGKLPAATPPIEVTEPVTQPVVTDDITPIDDMTWNALQKLAREKDIPIHGVKKPELIALLKADAEIIEV